ncbi:MAG TPA: histidine kinase [Burkholderiales bacterium]|nr:histidine kinase [Burkholderiales bacterium]
MSDTTAVKQTSLRGSASDRPASQSQSARLRSDTGDAKLFAAMRLILAITGLAIIYVDPMEPKAREAVTYGVLVTYCLYAAGVIAYGLRGGWHTDQRLLCALDVAFAFVLILWTKGTHSIFFYVLLFPILVVSFSHGYRDGLLFTAASLAAFVAAGVLVDAGQYELTGLQIRRPVYMLAFGYMVARWGGRQILFARRLMLLRDVNASSGRTSARDLIELNVRRIREFHAAQRCVLVLRNDAQQSYVIYASLKDAQHASAAREMSRESGERLLCFGENASVLYRQQRFPASGPRCVCITPDGKGERISPCPPAACEFVAELLEARYFAAVPYSQSDGTTGRLVLTSRHRRYTPDDVGFLRQFSTAVAKVVENLQLVDELVSSAAEHERVLISRDIHDAAVQPYIGLRLALEALQREPDTGVRERRIQDLVDMANATVRDLRGYTRGLLAGEIPGGSLREGILMQADRHRRFYGLEISTDVDARAGDLSGRFASHVFYIVVEALANVVKHTASRRAFIEVWSAEGGLNVRVGNERAPGDEAPTSFVPKSIKSRVEALGGSLELQHTEYHTVVHATVPAQ